MATATYTLAATSAAMVIQYGNDYFNDNGPKIYNMAPTTELPGRRHLLFNFPSAPDGIKYYRINRSHLSVRCGEISGSYIFRTYTFQKMDPQTITWHELSGYEKEVIAETNALYMYDSNKYVDLRDLDDEKTWTALARYGAVGIVENGESITVPSPTEIYGGADGLWPLFVIEYDDESIVPLVVKYAAGPHAGSYADRTKPITFAWTTERAADEYCLEDQAQTSAVFKWRNGSDGEWNEVSPAAPTDKTVTIPANTFPSGNNIQWFVTVMASSGQRYLSETIYSFATTDLSATASPVAPNGTVEDGSAPILFRWTVNSPTGNPQTRADLQCWWSNAWTDLGTKWGSDPTFTARAGTFLAGTQHWRVRVYNADDVAGPWSSFVSFTVIAAPPAPTVSATAVPFSTISWQVSGQQAWRATVDGKQYGPYFGTAKSFALPDYLEDGQHTVSVEVQGEYGLWSKPGSFSFTVRNVPGDQISLQGTFGVDAALSWMPASQTRDYLIYRDGVQIGHTTGRKFTDRVVQGAHEWHVINRLPGGYYSKSNTVQGELSTEQLALALLSGGDWLELEKTASPTRMESYTVSQTVELFHLAGQEFPDTEASPYKTMQGSFTVAWNLAERAEAAAFEALIGKPVIYKAPSGETLVGVLKAYSKQTVHFYRAYSATVQRIHWRDYVEAD